MTYTSQSLLKIAGGDANAPFYACFGRFISQFSAVEKLIHHAFHREHELPEAVSRALIGGEQLGKVTSMLNALVKAKGDQKRSAELQYILDQQRRQSLPLRRDWAEEQHRVAACDQQRREVLDLDAVDDHLMVFDVDPEERGVGRRGLSFEHRREVATGTASTEADLL